MNTKTHIINDPDTSARHHSCDVQHVANTLLRDGVELDVPLKDITAHLIAKGLDAQSADMLATPAIEDAKGVRARGYRIRPISEIMQDFERAKAAFLNPDLSGEERDALHGDMWAAYEQATSRPADDWDDILSKLHLMDWLLSRECEHKVHYLLGEVERDVKRLTSTAQPMVAEKACA